MATGTRNTIAVILAAGKGTRMKSDLPKVLHTILGKPMVSYVIEACKKAGVKEVYVVVGHQAEYVQDTLGPDNKYVLQAQQLGTGHALLMAANELPKYKGDVLVLAGDTPFLTSAILKKMIKKHQNTKASATMMTAVIDPPPAYGRILRDAHGRILRIVEERDASPEEKKITEVNTSHYCFRAEKIFPMLNELNTNNDQGEYYLTDIIEMLAQRNQTVESLTSQDPNILIGINDRHHLIACQQILKNQIVDQLISGGASILDPASTYIEPDVKIGSDTIIYPFTTLIGKTTIGKGCTIGPNTKLANATVGDNSTIEFAVVENRKLPKASIIGPFASVTGES